MDAHDLAAGDTGDTWWFVGKRELLAALLKKYVSRGERQQQRRFSKKKTLSILNVGGGTGEDLAVIGKYGTVTVVEPDKAAARHIPKTYRVIPKPIEKANVKQKFDIIIACDVLEHINDAKKAAKAMHGFLKEDGVLIGTVPARMGLWSGHDVALGHRRRYDKRLLREHLADFRIICLSGWNVALTPFLWVFRKGKKAAGKKGIDAKKVGPLDWPLKTLLRCENALIKRGVRLPTGVSMVFVARK